eukprot:m.505698 g.505698  ORF g.505698 m.505698 type:complete len:476 (-) comp21865_c0_seq6:746-2173(-)
MWSAGKPLLSHALGYLMRSQVRTAAFLRPEKHVKYVILGGGVSGGYAMDAFDAHGCSSDVLMISSEKYAPYERPALTKGFLAAGNPVRLPSFHTCAGSGDAAHDAAWYRPPRFDHGLMLGTSVDEFDAASKRLVLDLGTSIVYDKLIIATGASARKANFDNLGADHLVYVRDLNDAEGLYQRLQQLAGRADAAVAIIGGGFIGTEVAAAVAGFGISATVLCQESSLLQRLVPGPIAQRYQEAFKKNNVQVISNVTTDDVTYTETSKNGKYTVHYTCRESEDKAGETINADVVVVAVGAVPNSSLFDGKLLLTDSGHVVVDDVLRTSAKDVFAVGDVAAFPSANTSGIQVLDNVTHARESAKFAVRSVLGVDEASGVQPPAYTPTPHFYSRFLNFSWRQYGSSEGLCVLFAHSDDDSPLLGAWWQNNDGVITGTFLESATEEQHEALRACIGKSPVDDAVQRFLRETNVSVGINTM